jgi:uncharacterized protein YaaR (DUF327 family)
MIEIEKTGIRKTLKEKIEAAKKKKTATKTEIKHTQFFDEILAVQQVESIKADLEELLNEIDNAGKEFSKNPTMETLKKYKTLVKSFMEMIIKRIYKIKEKYGKKSFLKQKVYIIVEKINSKLEELTKYVLNKESSNLDLLATMDEIRGLLVDLYK